MLQWLDDYWPHIAGALTVLLSALATAHVVLRRRDERTGGAWVAVIWLSPILGPIAYMILGINRVERKAALLRAGVRRYAFPRLAPAIPPAEVASVLALPQGEQLAQIARATDKVTRRPLVAGNLIAPLRDGEEAYPAMLEAIAGATRSITLATYIFDSDALGLRFVAALEEACRRGVEVRVLVDDAGTRYSRPPIHWVLHRHGVRVARFLPMSSAWLRYLNLRLHRKILVVDGTLGFTGGMNLRAGHLPSEHPDKPIRDVHFRVQGPIVAQLQEVFAEDWQYTTGEALSGERWFPPLAPCGPVIARAITDGPDEDIDKLTATLMAALGSARRSIRVVTPYFLPGQALIGALSVAAMRGLEVDVVLPARSNIWMIDWARAGHLAPLLAGGCRVWLTPPPFDHSKLLVIDGAWSKIGSANWDPRSLRLNFELDVEAYDAGLAAQLEEIIGDRIATARRLGPDELERRPIRVRMRDGIARLFTPYL